MRPLQLLVLSSLLAVGLSTGCKNDVGLNELPESEGDDPGECTDGADNDEDGLFDCDDDDCAGSPDCVTTVPTGTTTATGTPTGTTTTTGTTTPCPDADGDGVCDADDACPGFDDNVDVNGNGTPDGCDTDCSTCPGQCLPDDTCCPPGGFCPTADTTLSGVNVFDVVYIPTGVTVTCDGPDPLQIQVNGRVWIEGLLAADGMDGTGGSGDDTVGVCGGYAGGDGFRSCTRSETTFCETTAAAESFCWGLVHPDETVVGPVCEWVSNAPGQPGYGPGAGQGGEMAHPLHNGAPGASGGGGGASYVTNGIVGGDGSTTCPSVPAGGVGGPTVSWPGGLPEGGSGGGAGGQARNGDCGLTCARGCTGWGGDGGAGGGVIAIDATGEVDVSGMISARGGSGGPEGGAVCAGAGGGGAGGAIQIIAPSLVTPGAVSAHLDVTGGMGGPELCPGIGGGGDGGDGLLITP